MKMDWERGTLQFIVFVLLELTKRERQNLGRYRRAEMGKQETYIKFWQRQSIVLISTFDNAKHTAIAGLLVSLSYSDGI
jgi:hypothetical protein